MDDVQPIEPMTLMVVEKTAKAYSRLLGHPDNIGLTTECAHEGCVVLVVRRDSLFNRSFGPSSWYIVVYDGRLVSINTNYLRKVE
jgi:hypothetical protein